jgi:hypothetical protein
MNDYQTYRNLPALAGICSMEEAARPGLTVDECVTRLKRFHYAFKRLHQIFNDRLTAEPIYELKMAFGHHSHLCAEHVSTLRERVGEMREPPLGLGRIPDPNLEIFFDEILTAPTTEELVAAIYGKALPSIKIGLERHLADTHRLADAPSVRIVRFALIETQDMLDYGAQAIPALVNQAWQEENREWLNLLDDCLAAAGSLDGTETVPEKEIQRRHSAEPYKYDPVPQRDERFPDPYNMGVNAEVFLYDKEMPTDPKTLMMHYKRIREIDVPEMMASIIAETPKKKWGYYRDMTRQLWDEARHAMMGEVGFVAAGVDWTKVMVNFTWSMALNTQLEPLERHAVLYFIEQGLMPKTGKRYEWEVGKASGHRLSQLFQDYDWADEVLHAKIGRDWYLPLFDDPKKGIEYGDECWSKVLMGWSQWRDDGLTEHRNWWPEVYTEACKHWNIEPDPKVLAYDTTYETVRADLKEMSVSG